MQDSNKRKIMLMYAAALALLSFSAFLLAQAFGGLLTLALALIAVGVGFTFLAAFRPGQSILRVLIRPEIGVALCLSGLTVLALNRLDYLPFATENPPAKKATAVEQPVVDITKLKVKSKPFKHALIRKIGAGIEVAVPSDATEAQLKGLTGIMVPADRRKETPYIMFRDIDHLEKNERLGVWVLDKSGGAYAPRQTSAH